MKHLEKEREDQKRLTWAMLFAVACLFVWETFFHKTKLPEKTLNKVQNEKVELSEFAQNSKDVESISVTPKERQLIISSSNLHRVFFENDFISGSINLEGGILDDVSLKNHFLNVKNKTPISLLSPRGADGECFVESGWLSASDSSNLDLPNSKTMWTLAKNNMASDAIELHYNNTLGYRFTIKFVVTSDYLIRVEQSVTNVSANDEMSIIPALLIKKHMNDSMASKGKDSYEGPLGFFGGKFQEIPYSKLLKGKVRFDRQKKSWAGVSEKYWLIAAIPDDDASIVMNYDIDEKISKKKENSDFKLIIKGSKVKVLANSVKSWAYDVFVGAKDLDLLEKYTKDKDIQKFAHAIDLGYMYFLTKPMLHLLQFIQGFVGNYGIAIAIMTLFIRILLFPFAHKAYKSIARIKLLNPRIEQLKESYKENKLEREKAVMQLYRTEKINPLSSIVPLLLQIPIFIALFKTLRVSISLRNSVFISGWIEDLSSAEPTSLLNLFGLIPIPLPSFLQIGILPVVMGLTMWLQQKLTEVSTDKMSKDKKMLTMYMPFLLTFFFARFPSGLMIYWIVSNCFSIVQQYAVNRIILSDKKNRS